MTFRLRRASPSHPTTVCHRATRPARSTPPAGPAPTARRTMAATALTLLALALVSPRPAAAAGATPSASPRVLLLDGAALNDTLVAVGERGTILLSADQAASWQRVPSPVRATLTGVTLAPVPPGTPAGAGWAVGHDAVILGTADLGRTWTKQYQGENLQDSFLDVLAVDRLRAVAVGAFGLYAATTDGGKTWTRRKLTNDDYHFNRLSRGPTGTLYLAGERGTLFRSTDSGDTWTSIAAPYEGSFYGVMPLDRRTLLAHGLRGHLFRSADDGQTWQRVPFTEPVLLATGAQLPGNTLVLSGQARSLYVSTDYGKTFVASPAALPTAVAELLVLPDHRLLALGEAGATVISLPR
jgi:photosystem II stability/assembly factor-like uncharacterized protein